MNPFKAVGTTITNLMSVIDKTSKVLEDVVDLAGNEVNMLSEAQDSRMDTIHFERDELLNSYSDKRKEWQSNRN